MIKTKKKRDGTTTAAVSTAVVVASLEKAAALSIRKVTDLKIKTKDDYELAAELVRRLKDLSAEAKRQEESITAPMKQALKAAQSHFKPFQTKVTKIETAAKAQMLEFLDRQKNFALRAEADLESGKIKKVSTLIAKQDALRVDNGTAQVRKVWTLFIDKPDRLPLKYLIPDESAIREACKAGAVPPGCRWEQVDSIAI